MGGIVLFLNVDSQGMKQFGMVGIIIAAENLKCAGTEQFSRDFLRSFVQHIVQNVVLKLIVPIVGESGASQPICILRLGISAADLEKVFGRSADSDLVQIILQEDGNLISDGFRLVNGTGDISHHNNGVVNQNGTGAVECLFQKAENIGVDSRALSQDKGVEDPDFVRCGWLCPNSLRVRSARLQLFS